MEKLLEKLARQLDSIDEASLMALWSKYATITSRFEPTKRWEEACLIFSLIQAKHFKNQLFNYCWQQEKTRGPARSQKAGRSQYLPSALRARPKKAPPRARPAACFHSRKGSWPDKNKDDNL